MSKFKDNKNNQDKIKVFASVPLMVGIIFVVCMGYGLFLFVTIYDVARKQLLEEPIYYIITCLFTVVLCTVILVIAARRFFTIIEIGENGIKTSLFHFFYKKTITWEELTEIRYYESILPFIFFSKDMRLTNMSYDSVAGKKGLIQVSLTPKVYKVITKYWQKPIENLSDIKVKALKLDK